MYTVLLHIPRYEKAISESDLEHDCQISPNRLKEILGEAKWTSHDYANECAEKSHYWILTENGQAAIEEYERAVRADRLVICSLVVSIVAAVAGIGSAIASAITLLQ